MQRGALPMKIALVDDDPRALAQLESLIRLSNLGE